VEVFVRGKYGTSKHVGFSVAMVKTGGIRIVDG
jgi:hypothetical protein